MLFEDRRVCLYESCRNCGGKLFRYLRRGTCELEEYGTTHCLQVWDRCEECRDISRETHVALHDNDLEERVRKLFDLWERCRLTDVSFAKSIQAAFRAAGGWTDTPERKMG